jgi:CxxC motif-containing protein
MKELVCILCPNGCRLHVEDKAESEGLTEVGSLNGLVITGNLCKRGLDFAAAEFTNPSRIVTTTVRTIFPDVPILPVRTDREIPKGKIRYFMEIINGITVTEFPGIGEIVLKDIPGLGINVIATSNLLKEREV